MKQEFNILEELEYIQISDIIGLLDNYTNLMIILSLSWIVLLMHH